MGINSEAYNKIRNERRKIKYAENSSYRESILKKQKEYNKLESTKLHQKEYDKNKSKEKIKERVSKYYMENKEKVVIRVSKYNKENRVAVNKRVKENRIELRKFIIDKYGGKCNCCGESTFEFLSFDHKNGGGSKHRKELGRGSSVLLRWIVNNDFPDSIRILCHNCNQSMGCYGYCPHNKSVAEFNNVLPFGRLLTRG